MAFMFTRERDPNTKVYISFFYVAWSGLVGEFFVVAECKPHLICALQKWLLCLGGIVLLVVLPRKTYPRFIMVRVKRSVRETSLGTLQG